MERMRYETREQLEVTLTGVEMLNTRFQDWDFGWRIEDVLEPAVILDLETSGLVVSGFDEGPKIASMPATQVRGWFVQSSYSRVREGRSERGLGLRFFVERGEGVEQVVRTCWRAIQQVVEHELRESFTVELLGRRVLLFDPHKLLEDMAHGSREG